MKITYTLLAGILLMPSAMAQIDIYYSDAYSIEEKCAREAEQYEPEKDAIATTESVEKTETLEEVEPAPDYHDAYELCLNAYKSDY